MTNSLIVKKQELLLEWIADGFSGARRSRMSQVLAVLSVAGAIDASCARRLADFGLSEGRFAVLLATEIESAPTPATIAERIGVTRATVTGLLDGLEKLGYLVRTHSSTDRRSVSIVLTEAGGLAIHDLTPVYADWIDSLARGISEADLNTFHRVLSQISRNLS